MLRFEQILDSIFTRHRWVLHVLLWAVVLLWYVIFFGRQNSNYLQTLFFVGLLMPVTISTTYFLNYYLVPRYLLKEKYGLFLLYFIYTLIGSIFLEMIVSLTTFYVMAELKTKNMSPASFDIILMLTSLVAVVFLGMAIKLLLHWRTSREDYQKLMREKVEKELDFLKSQLNPHFLFNTLNNLYYLTTQKSDDAPAAILQLSEILDYSLYSSKSMFVPFEKEWQQLQNYMALEKLHYEDRLKSECTLSGNVSDCVISPMILVTLAENAYKHGVLHSNGAAWIKTNVVCNDGQIRINIRNSYQQHSQKSGGIGLNNLRTQLNLLYPHAHRLEIDNTIQGEFGVTLTLETRK